MKAVEIAGLRQMQIIDVPEPELRPDEVLLRLCYVGFCGSDLSTYLGRNPMVRMPVIPGHEVGAVIEQVGAEVPEGLKPGMTVTVNPYTNCGKCASCRNSRVNACQHNETLGVQRSGAMCERIALPWEKVIPAGLLTPRTCALIEPMSVGFHAVSRAQVTDIDVVLVIGCGMVGMGAVVRSVQRGATVVAADIDDDKLALAREMGASYTINTRTDDVHTRLLEMTSGFGPDVVIEAVGSSETYQMAVDEVAFTGRVICIGYAKTEVSFQTKYFVQKELDIRGSRNAQPSDFRAVIHYLEKGSCPVDALISREVTPEEAPQAMQQWAEQPGKVFRILVRLAALCILCYLLCVSTAVKADDYETLHTEKIQNPMLWADVPDPDVIRVGDTYYLVSTTMHLMPGAPVMASKDLKNWETVGYIFDSLTDSPKYDLQQGTVYGRGQWATSLKYHNGRFYALLAPNEQGAMGDTYIFTAEKAEGPWTILSRMRHFHDCSLFFDDDGRVYVVYGTGELMELKPDLSDVIEGTYQRIFQREDDEKGLLEGSRMIKHNGKYYLLMISHTYAPGRHRREVCYRADDIHGPYEKQVILESEFGGFSYEAQGTIVDTPDGDWYGIIFQDRGGVGRVLTLMPCRWINGWPMLGDENGRVPDVVRPLVSNQPPAAIVKADDFSSARLGLHWQWNHNPVDQAWSLTERPGYLRLKTSRAVSTLYLAPNTLTQRMEGPGCSGSIVIDLSKMRDGDCAGLAAFNSDTGALIVRKQGRRLVLEMTEMTCELSERDKSVTKTEEKVVERTELKQSKVWLRIDADFRPGQRGGRDAANFYYSLDGEQWTQIGTADYRMRFDWRRFFMGTKFGIFCYATKRVGGYVDIDTFNYTRNE